MVQSVEDTNMMDVDAGMDMDLLPDPSHELDAVFAALQSLASPEAPSPTLGSAHYAPLFARIKYLNRAANAASRQRKARTTHARHEMDMTHLGLQNLMYEKRHLEKEIEKCENFASIYQDIPLHSEGDFIRLAPEEMRSSEMIEDEHQMMLARLRFELQERHRLDARKKELAEKREQLMKENKEFTNSLNALGQQLDAMAKSSMEIQKKMHELAAIPVPPVPPQPDVAMMTPPPDDAATADVDGVPPSTAVVSEATATLVQVSAGATEAPS